MERKKPFNFLKTFLFSAVIALAMFGGYTYTHRDGIALSNVNAAVSQNASRPKADAATELNVVVPDFSDIVARHGPAVVNVSVSGSNRTALSQIPGMPRLDPNDPFSEFFRRFQIPAPRGDMPTRGQGSGFIVSPDGVILTNAHVIADADEVMVRLTDRREFKAKVIGVDKLSDVGVLKIDAKNLPSVTIGEPARAGRRVGSGDWITIWI